jgi:integrase
LTEHEYYSLDDLKKIASTKPETLAERRGIAAMAFLYLTGMRVGAFLTLLISCVDLRQKKIYQVTSMGVRTKFHKASVTTFLNIPELIEVVKDWDEEVRTLFPSQQTWYAPIRPQREGKGQFFITEEVASPYRGKELRREMKSVCVRAGVVFRSAHKLRHGPAVFGIKNSKNIKELKAISQNMMHSSISVTDSIYGNLSGEDFIATVSKLGVQPDDQSDGVSGDLLKALIKLSGNPELLKKILDS